MVVGEALDHRLERDDARGRDHPGLAHLAAEPGAVLARFVDVRAAATEQRADRRAEALRQAEHHRVAPVEQRRGRHPERDRRVPEARAVAVHGDAVGTRDRGDLRDLVGARRATARRHDVFSRNSALIAGRWCAVAGERALDVVRVQTAVAVGQWPELHARVRPPTPRARAGTRARGRRRAPRCRATPSVRSAIWLAMVPDGT